jgi:hypothetical protein
LCKQAPMTKIHNLDAQRPGKNHSLGSKNWPHKPNPNADIPTVRKVPASSVPYGESISRNGRTVWAAYDGERLVAVGATADEARQSYRKVRAAERQAKNGIQDATSGDSEAI